MSKVKIGYLPLYIKLYDDSNPAKDWIQMTIPLEYSSLTTYPTHIIISCAASMYGDYFTGYDNSKLWLDGMELLYE